MTMKFGVFIPQGWRMDLVGIEPAEQWATMSRLADLAEHIAEPALRGELGLLCLLCLGIRGGHRIDPERQNPAQLSGGAADCAAQSLLAEDAADRAAQRLAYLAEQVAEPALRRQLWCQLRLL